MRGPDQGSATQGWGACVRTSWGKGTERGSEWGPGTGDHGGVASATGVRTCVGEANVKDICPGPAEGAAAAAAASA